MNMTAKFFLRPAALLALTAIGACTTVNIQLPPVTETPTQAHYPGRIIWHDLLTNDLEGSKSFYGGLFGWTYEELPVTLGFGKSSKYVMIRSGDRLIGGMLDVRAADTKGNSSQWVVVMSVSDIDAAVESVKQGGGRILTPPTDLNERGRIAVTEDDAGALFAMLETRSGDPLEHEADAGEFMWDEVWTPDVQKAAQFYQNLAPFELIGTELGATTYEGLAVNGIPRAGVLRNPAADEGLGPTWVSYIKVRDMSALDKVAGLGGRVLLAARERPIGGQVAIIAGPSGAGVALQTWDDDQEKSE